VRLLVAFVRVHVLSGDIDVETAPYGIGAIKVVFFVAGPFSGPVAVGIGKVNVSVGFAFELEEYYVIFK